MCGALSGNVYFNIAYNAGWIMNRICINNIVQLITVIL